MSFSKPEFLRKFDERSEAITKNKKNMGIIETVIELEREEAKEQGLELGATIKAIIAIRNMLKEKFITETKIIAHILDISVDFVEQAN